MHNYTTFTAKQLTKVGFVHNAKEDFGDDGTNFKVYELNGVTVTYAKSDGQVYLSVRPDYMGLEYSDYSKLPSYSLLDEFNGVSEYEVNVDKLLENIKTFQAELDNKDAIIAPIKKELYAKYNEYMRLIAQYDWAVEGFNAPASMEVSRETAVEIRTNLVKLASEVRL